MSCPECDHCRRVAVTAARRRRKPKPRRYTLSVSAKAYRLFQAAAEARGWSVRQLVEEATRGV